MNAAHNNTIQWLGQAALEAEWTPKPHLAWISEPGSLTQKLVKLTNQEIEHKLYAQEWSFPTQEEASLLNCKLNEMVRIRKIGWLYSGELWIFAKAIIPKTSTTGAGEILVDIGAQPLGNILFKDPNLLRSDFEFTLLNNKHIYFQQACQLSQASPQQLWTRRSIFYFYKQPLLVVEIFFPSFFQFLNQYSPDQC